MRGKPILLALVLIIGPPNPGVFCADPGADTSTGLQITSGPYLQQPTGNAVTIVWRTNQKCVSRVEYGMDGELGDTAIRSRHGLVDANTTLHAIRLRNLRPGTTYQYRAVSKEIQKFGPYKVNYGDTVKSDVHTFTTLDRKKSDFSFLVLNDRHEKTKPLRAALRAVNWDAVDLVFLNGDMLNHLEGEEQVYRSLVDPCVESFAKRIPFIYVRGNHEARGYFARNLLRYFPTDTETYFHAFTHGPVRFVVLDSGEDKPDTSKEYSGLVDFDPYRKNQAQWLAQEIAGRAFKKARFRVVVFHIPPFHGNDWHGERQLRKHWAPLLDKGRVDLLLCGHTHRYARISPEKDQHTYPIVINDDDTAIRLDVSAKEMSGTVTRDDGLLIDRFTLPVKRTPLQKIFGN